jgi:alpha-amylase
MIKYAEANRMHKKMLALSALCRSAGDPPEARRAIGRAQCNDAYWHGVFGGLYLPHLRDAIWQQLARAEHLLRSGETPRWEIVDLDADGHDELWIHDATFSALLSPHRGGVIEEFTVFAHGINYANTLTRRREAYHEAMAPANSQGEHSHDSGAPANQDHESRMRLHKLPPLDHEARVLIRERVLAAHTSEIDYERGEYDPIWTVASAHLELIVESTAEGIRATFRSSAAGVPVFEKQYDFRSGGELIAEYRWNAAALGGGMFAPEISFAGPMEITASPGAPIWSHDIVTVAKSEKALEQTVQGRSVTPRWPTRTESAKIKIRTAGRL